MTVPTSALNLRQFEFADERQLNAWLSLPHVVAWWGGRPAAEASIALALASETSLRCMIEWSGQPIGYGHAIDGALTGADRLAQVPAGTFEADLFIADAAHQGRGLGADALVAFSRELFATLFVDSMVVRMPVSTEAIVRDLERRGFRWVAIDATPTLQPRWVLITRRFNLSTG